MNPIGPWTPFALEAEHEHFGMTRIAQWHNALRKQRDALAADSVTMNDLLLSALNLFDPYGDGRLIAPQSECADVCKRIADSVLQRGNE